MTKYEQVIKNAKNDVQRGKWFKYAFLVLIISVVTIIVGLLSSETFIVVGALLFFLGFALIFVALIYFSKQQLKFQKSIVKHVWIPMLNGIGLDQNQTYRFADETKYDTTKFATAFNIRGSNLPPRYIIQSDNVQITYHIYSHTSGQQNTSVDFSGLLFVLPYQSENLKMKTKFPNLVKLSRFNNDNELDMAYSDALYSGELGTGFKELYDSMRNLDIQYKWIYSDGKHLYVAVEATMFTRISGKSDVNTISLYEKACNSISAILHKMVNI